jgi:DNA replication licensing factor MCM2
MQLREIVRSDDIDFAIQMILESFLQSQKYSIANNLKKKFAHYLSNKNDYFRLLLSVLNKLSKEQFQYLKYFEKKMEVVNEIRISKDIFEKEASDLGIHNLDDFYQSDTFTKKNKIESKEIICQI